MCDINDPLGQTHSPAVAITILIWKLFCFARFRKVGTDGRTDEQTKRAKIVIIISREYGSASWINLSVANQKIALKDNLENKFSEFLKWPSRLEFIDSH